MQRPPEDRAVSPAVIRSLTEGSEQIGSSDSTQEVEIELGHEITVGRHGDLVVGVDPEDTGISRHAVAVSLSEKGWSIRGSNANGVVVYPWGQSPRWIEIGSETGMRWPLIGIRLVGARSDLLHWVHLENPAFAIAHKTELRASAHTSIPQAPTPLTPSQTQALQAVFAQYLAWPPVAGPAPMTLQAAAARLGVSHAAVYQRLEAARERAYQLGAPSQIGVSEPEYIFALVRAGYVQVPDKSVREAS